MRGCSGLGTWEVSANPKCPHANPKYPHPNPKWCMAGNTLGNLAAYAIQQHLPTQVLFWLLAAVCLLAAGCCFVLVSPHPPNRPPDHPPAPLHPPLQGHVGVLGGVGEVFRALRLRVVLQLVPLLVFIGWENSFWAGEFTQLLPLDRIGLVLAGLGLCEVVAGLMAGPLQGVLGWRGVLVLGSVGFGIALGLTCCLKTGLGLGLKVAGVPVLAFLAAGGYGVGDALFNTVCIAQLGTLSDDEGLFGRRVAFVLFQSVNTFFNAAGYFLAPAWPVHGHTGSLVQVYALMAWLGIATLVVLLPQPSTTPHSYAQASLREGEDDDEPTKLQALQQQQQQQGLQGGCKGAPRGLQGGCKVGQPGGQHRAQQGGSFVSDPFGILDSVENSPAVSPAVQPSHPHVGDGPHEDEVSPVLLARDGIAAAIPAHSMGHSQAHSALTSSDPFNILGTP